MISALIIDDEPLSRSLIKEFLEDHPDIRIVGECGDGFEGIKAIMQFKPQLIFLDVQMPKINGFEMLELVDDPPAVIFVTAFDEYAIRAFELHAVDYLLKPFNRERFSKAVHNFLQRTASPGQQVWIEQTAPLPFQKDRIVVKTGGKIKIIPVEDVIYFEASDDYIRIHTTEGVFLKKKTMSRLEETLPQSQFVRVHRSFMVNVSQITRIDPYEKDNYQLLLLDETKVPVSRAGYSRLKEILGL